MPESDDSLIALSQSLMAAGKWKEARSKLEQARQAAPGDVLIALMLAEVYKTLGDNEPALDLFRSIHQTMPELPGVSASLAGLYCRLARFNVGKTSFRKDAVQRPDQPDCYAGLGEVHAKQMEIPSAERQYRRAFVQAPMNHTIVGNLAEMLSFLGHSDEAEIHYRKALELAPDNPGVMMNYAAHLISNGRAEEGWRYYEARLLPKYPSAPIRNLSMPRWDGSSPGSTRLLVVSEQGIGDEVRHGALLPELAKQVAELTVECDPRLTNLFERSIPGLRAHGFSRQKRSGRGHYSYSWLPDVNRPDRYVEIGSLSFIMRRKNSLLDNETGYLVPDPERTSTLEAALKEIAAGRKRVGISWTSSVLTAERELHYPPAALWRDLLKLPNACLINLQYGAQASAIHAFETASESRLHSIEGLDLRNDIEGLVALISRLDLVITVSTATSAIAAAAGCPTIDFLANTGLDPVIDGRDALLSATRRMVQETPGDWSSPLERAHSLALALLEPT